jgi:AcrR family transcriptional regulator
MRTNETRELILEALVRVIARNGLGDISVPVVAREAGVSLPTVYRYFPYKRDLIAALDDYAHRKGSFTSAELFGPIDTPEQLAAVVPEIFKRRKAIEPTLSAAMNSRLGYQIRRPQFEQRAEYLRRALRPAAEHLPRQERAWLTDIVLILNSFATARAFKDYLGLDTDEAAKRVAWAIRLLAKGAAAS